MSHVCFCSVMLLASSLLVLFLDFVRACTVIKPELSSSHLTTEEEEQIQLLSEAGGWAAPAKYVNKYL